MNIWLVVPVKSLDESKSRLAHILSIEQRRELITSLLTRLLKASRGIEEIQRTIVVSPDVRVSDIAQKNGAFALHESGRQGLNAALSQARRFSAKGAEVLLILPADLPNVNPSDIRFLLTPLFNSSPSLGEHHKSQESGLMVICPDQHGTGTNALLIHPLEHFEFHFGPDSLREHLQEAGRTGRISHVVEPPGLRFDLDDGDDWERYLQHSADTMLEAFTD